MKDRIVDRRERQRRHLLYYLDIHDTETGELLGQMGDITTEGLLLISDAPLQIEEEGEIRHLKILLPEKNNFSIPDLNVRVKTCWTSPDFNPDLHCTGFQLLEPDEKTRAAIRQLIKILGFRE